MPAAPPTEDRSYRPSWRRPRSGALNAALLLILTGGCGTDANPPGDDPGSVRIVVAYDTDPAHLNPAVTTNGGVHSVSELLYDGLVSIDENLAPRPALAERWEFLDDGRRARFHLRRDVTWHDGTPFTSRDVVYTFEEVLLRYHSRTRASLASVLRDVTAPDSYTVDFIFEAPYGPLLLQLDVTEAPILPAHVYEGTDPLSNPANRAPVGTGPFRFSGSRPDEIRYRANPDYFDGPPSVDEVVWRLIPDPGTQVIALEAGELDFVFGVPGPDRDRLDANPDIQLLETTRNPGGSNCIMTLVYNLDRPAIEDLRLRRAIAHAIDQHRFVSSVLFGQGRVARAPISSGLAFAHAADLDMPEYAPEKARALLAEMGWGAVAVAEGTRAGSATVPTGSAVAGRPLDLLYFPSFDLYAQLLRAQMRDVGIDLRLMPMEPSVFVDRVYVRRDFDLALVSYCNGPDPEIGVRRMYVSSNIQPIPFSNGAGYRNPEVDTLFDQARAILEPEKRTPVYRRIQEILVRDLPYFWIVETVATRAYRTRCRGFTPDGHFAAHAVCDP